MTHPFSSRYWQSCSTREFSAASPQTLRQTVAILPLGATEQHGPHLPCSVDTAIVNAVVDEGLRLLPADWPVLVLPTLAIGYSVEHMGFAGTLSFSASTYLLLLQDVAHSVAMSGIRRLILFNAHGGNIGLMEAVGRDARAKYGLLVHTVSWFNLPLFDSMGQDLRLQWGEAEKRFGAHAGALETALMLSIEGALVSLQHVKHFDSYAETKAQQHTLIGNGKSSQQAWMAEDYNPEGAMGNASAATAAQGDALRLAAAQSFVQLIAEVRQQILPHRL